MVSVHARLAPALLTMPENCGTLAAARCLADAGAPVWTATSARLAPGAWSSAVARRLRCPGLDRPEAAVDWLLEVGRRHPGMVLYPTCDDYAWLQAVHAKRLAGRFQTYGPGAGPIQALLDKRLLHEHCRAVGLDTPDTHFPETKDEAAALARRVEAPVLLKQRTQILSATHTKGRIVTRMDDLARAFQDFIVDNAHGRAIEDRMPGASMPLVQEYFTEGVSGSLLVSGFVDESGELFVARAAHKVLQFPRRLGIALCLEAIDLDADLARRIRELCVRVGYFGVFQVELLTVGDRRLLIDFNPRYYHYLAFDVGRGMPLPLFVHAAATGERRELERLVRDAAHDRGARAFSYTLQLNELLLAQRISGAMPREETSRWRAWHASYDGDLVDAVERRGDPLPTWIDLATRVYSRVRHPRAFVRQVALDR